MKSIWKSIKNLTVTGFLFLLPVFVLFLIFKNAYGKIFGFASKASHFLGLENIAGVKAQPIIAVLMLLLIFLVAGMLVKILMLGRFRNWLEENILELIPGYINTREKMLAKVNKKPDTREPVLVRNGNLFIPGLLVSENENRAVVFIPETPETFNGQVWVVNSSDLEKHSASNKDFVNSLKHAGKDLAVR